MTNIVHTIAIVLPTLFINFFGGAIAKFIDDQEVEFGKEIKASENLSKGNPGRLECWLQEATTFWRAGDWLEPHPHLCHSRLHHHDLSQHLCHLGGQQVQKGSRMHFRFMKNMPSNKLAYCACMRFNCIHYFLNANATEVPLVQALLHLAFSHLVSSFTPADPVSLPVFPHILSFEHRSNILHWSCILS